MGCTAQVRGGCLLSMSSITTAVVLYWRQRIKESYPECPREAMEVRRFIRAQSAVVSRSKNREKESDDAGGTTSH